MQTPTIYIKWETSFGFKEKVQKCPHRGENPDYKEKFHNIIPCESYDNYATRFALDQLQPILEEIFQSFHWFIGHLLSIWDK